MGEEETAGRVAYEAFAEFVSASGKTGASWYELPEDTRQGWEVAATAAILFETSSCH